MNSTFSWGGSTQFYTDSHFSCENSAGNNKEMPGNQKYLLLNTLKLKIISFTTNRLKFYGFQRKSSNSIRVHVYNIRKPYNSP